MKLLLALIFLPLVCRAIFLTCEDSSQDDGHSEALVICTIESLEVTSEDLNISSTIHPDYFYELRFDSCKVPQLPATFFEQIEKLRTVRAPDSHIEDIQGVFGAARHLRKLYLAGNAVKQLDGQTFGGARDLGLLDLAHNQIGHVAKEAFGELKYLSHVNLSHNQIEVLDSDLFRANQILHTLDVSFNQLKTLELHVCQLASVYAAFNQIENFEMNLVEIDILSNRQYYSRFLVKIFVNNNDLVHFKVDKRFKVRHLGLDHNKINDLSALGERLPEQIEILDLSFNDLGSVTKDTFSSLSNLRSLYLRHSAVRFHDDFVFQSLVNLTELDLSYNHLQEFDTKLLSTLNAIELLKVDGNNLTVLDVESLPQRVFAISLFDNDWDCDYLEELFDRMRLSSKVSVPSMGDAENRYDRDVNGVPCSPSPEEHTTHYQHIEHTTVLNDED